MLSDHDPIPSLAVKDVQRARDFYEGVLGMSPTGEPPEGVMYSAGRSTFMRMNRTDGIPDGSI